MIVRINLKVMSLIQFENILESLIALNFTQYITFIILIISVLNLLIYKLFFLLILDIHALHFG